MTEWFDFLLLEGGGLKDIHLNNVIKNYKTHGCLFNNNGEPQQRTLFGHIADRIFNEDCIIKIDGSLISKDTNQNFLSNAYDCNSFIRIDGFKGETRPDEVADKIGGSLALNASYLPDWSYVKPVIDKLPNEAPTLDEILDQIEQNAHADKKVLKQNWREITRRNIPIWLATLPKDII